MMDEWPSQEARAVTTSVMTRGGSHGRRVSGDCGVGVGSTVRDLILAYCKR